MNNLLWKKFLGFDPDRTTTFPGQQPGEEVELLTNFHWMRMVPFYFGLSLIVLVVISLNVLVEYAAGLPDIVHIQINAIVIALIIHLFCHRLYNHFLQVVIITNQRLIHIQHSVFLKRERETIPLVNIQDIHYKQKGILPRIFGYGELVVLGSSSDVKYSFHYIPRVNRTHHLLCEVHQKRLGKTELMVQKTEE